ncbi:hypothetical protein EZJ43_14510 [Pedobacter changchengzhani]|uniref:DUF5672 domain-containing protein n=1 Tax=Pedobacter changchengzhani TaxID=2529274 RepID=A0A4R5MIC9_9SPHI|nr:DUF5672 family protein [Pedobacter changchengzhani]TDG35304.1 hypothetical protein EZJ43_14510 [Pedobacter changchengzhani]
MTSAILIIIHKPDPQESELASLEQCWKKLNNYKIVLIFPKGMDIGAYLPVAPNISHVAINPKWLSTYRNFNKLKTNPLLYKLFSSFDFILFYELDAWVFNDELQYWCSQNYDYIGAPWYEDLHNANSDSKFIGVGNGGFSLRKVKSHLKVLYSFSYVNSPVEMMKETFKNRGLTFRSLLHVVSNFTFRNNTFYLFNNFNSGEDIFWGQIVSRSFKNFRLPNERTASKFAMEVKAPQLYKENNNILPFGCHAWERYHKDFWMQFIKVKEENE